MIVADSSLLYALLDRRDRRHDEARVWYAPTAEAIATTPLVLAEVDYFALRRGADATRAFYRDIAAGAYTVEWWRDAARETAAIAEEYLDLELGLTDASLVALAARLGTNRIATFDERHFRAVRPRRGAAAFEILPMDA